MKKFYQTTAVIALIAIVFGMVFSIAGVCIGGTVEAAGNLVEVQGVHGLHFHFPFFWFGSDQREENSDRPVESVDPEKMEELEQMEKPQVELAESLGEHEVELHYTEDIRELEWEIDYATVTVLPGEEFAVYGDHLNQSKFKSYVENGIWYVEYDTEDSWGWNWKEGLEIPSAKEAALWITVPFDAELKYASIALGAGEASLEGLSVQEADLELGAGNVTIRNMKISEEGSMELGMGNLKLQDVAVNGLDIECGMGSVKGTASLTGDTEIECGMGSVELTLAAQESDYNYEVSCAMGSVRLGDHHSYDGISDTFLQNDAGDTMYLECGVGTITLKYQK